MTLNTPDVVTRYGVSGLIVGGALGTFLGFGGVFWMFDPKAMELPGFGDLAFFVSALLGGFILGWIGLLLGRAVGAAVDRRRARKVALDYRTQP
jgi:hypothetical protein